MTKQGFIIKKDKFRKVRGGTSKLIDVICTDCKSHICFYQKDGPGLLKRMYLDRISDSKYENLQNFNFNDLPQFTCENCGKHLGAPIIYEKEKRYAFRLFVGSVSKKLIKQS